MTRRVGNVALLTDFGTRDWYVATLKAVILSRCPEAHLIDITHEIPPQDVTAGAFTLAAVVPWLAKGTVVIAVVDPGVGTQRAILAAHANGRYLIGPDNGLLTLALRQARHVVTLTLTTRRYWLKTVSRTFQARDVMAPVAAHLAGGGAFETLGARVRRITPLALPAIERKGGVVSGRIVHIDSFGNLITNVPASLVFRADGRPRGVLRYKRHSARVVSSYAAGGPNELIAVAGSLNLMELAVRNGSAAWIFTARRGDAVQLTAEGRR